MGMRRIARHHDTVAVRSQAAASEDFAEHQQGDRVMTIDGPGRVVAVNDGPFAGSEEYEIRLEGGLGGGTYSPGQVEPLGGTEASVGQAEATGVHLASDDYPELGTLLFDRPDPATQRHTASLEYQDGMDGGLSLTPAAVVDDDEGQIMRDMGQYHTSPTSVMAARAFDHYHPGQVYLRFGHWPENERSQNNVTGHPEDGVSVYDLDEHGDPMDPDPDLNRGHEHDEYCEPDCDLDSWNDDYGNDTRQEMHDRTGRAQQARRRGVPQSHPDVGHLVKGDMIGIGHDGEPLLNNVRRVGDWMDHRHLFIPGASKHPLARDEYDDDYEPPEERPTQHTARDINGEHIDDHGSAPEWHRAANPNEYDRQSTEGEPDPAWIEDIRETQQAMASHPDDGAHEDDEFDESGMCGVGHDGPCPDLSDLPPASNRHTAMPSKYHPRPEGFHTEIHSEWENEDRLHSWNHRRLVGYLNGSPVGSINFHVHPNEEALKVNMLHTMDSPEVRGKGVASAMMDDLYTKHPHAWINHGWRTPPGRRWWRSYQEPEGHEDRNIHNVHPSKGWNDYFSPYDVADDIGKNEINDPGHHTDKHPVVDEWRHDKWEHEGDESNHDRQENRDEYSEGEDKEYCDHCDDWTDHSTYDHEEKEDDEEETHDPDPRETRLHHGTSLYLKPDDHAFVHNPTLPEKDRAHRLLDIMGRGNMPTHSWHRSPSEALERSWKVEDNLPAGGTRLPATHVTFHAEPFEHHEVHEEDSAGDETPQFDTDGRAAHFQTSDNPINFHLNGMSWGASAGRKFNHTFDKPEPVGMPLAQDPTRGNLADREDRADTRREHKERYAPRQSPLNPAGTGEQMKLFSAKSSLPSIHAREESERQPHYEDFSGVPNLEHPLWGGAFNPTPGAAEEAVTESVPVEVHPDDVPRHPSALSMLVTAAMDPGFRFHVTAAWRDVQAKAKRIRSQGGVSIKHSDGMTVVADVKGDHNVYETSLQRSPGRRQSVAVYACGCKWGAYHWGASDDLSRFAGRMCSHALALQYEAASRGMFGRDVEVDDTRPRWVPSKVVVKYDIDTGQHMRATASVPEQSPLMAALAFMKDDDPAARVVLAAVNDMFGDTSGYSEPSLMDPLGPTVPWNRDESPASAGNLSGAEPHNWGSITGPTMLPRIASAISTEAFWQAVVPLVRALAPAAISHEVNKHQQDGAEATLHDEPEGALPETDGEDHTASLGDVDIAESHDPFALDGDALSPENPSMQTQGAADIVADFQRSAAARTLMDGGAQGGKSNSDIAQAAEAFLAKTAASAFTRAEQDALIHESPGTQASNTDRLDIAGTHYAEIQRLEDGGDDDGWLF